MDLFCYISFLSLLCCRVCVVTCWERADLLALLCVAFCSVFVTFPIGVPGQVCDTGLYRFLIFAFLFTLMRRAHINCSKMSFSREKAYFL